MFSKIRRIEGLKEGNVVHIRPEGNILRWDLMDWHGEVILRRIPMSTRPLTSVHDDRSNQMDIAEGLMRLGLIKDGLWVSVLYEDDDTDGTAIAIINTTSDEVEFWLKKSPN